MSQLSTQNQASNGQAFSLLEVVSVLAILSILAAMVVPVVIKRVDAAAVQAETSSLSSLSDGLFQYIARSNAIPDHTAWVQALGSQLPLAATNISRTPRRHSRAFLIDTNGWLGASLASSSWVQPPGGILTAPTSARMMLISTMAIPLPLSSGKPGTAAFNDVWNTQKNSKPSTWTNWTGKGEDLLIQRINVEPVFHRLILINGYNGGQGYFSIGSNSPAAVPLGGSGTNTYYLDGTVLNLYGTNQNLMAREVIRADMSRIFEYGLWRDQLNLGVTNGINLNLLSAMFYTNSPPGGWGSSNLNKYGGSPQSVLGLLNAYMNGYTTWAESSPCFSYFGAGNPSGGDLPPFDEINNAISAFSKGAAVVVP